MGGPAQHVDLLERGARYWGGLAAGDDCADPRRRHAGFENGVDDLGESRQCAVIFVGGGCCLAERQSGAHGVFSAVVGDRGHGEEFGADAAAVMCGDGSRYDPR